MLHTWRPLHFVVRKYTAVYSWSTPSCRCKSDVISIISTVCEDSWYFFCKAMTDGYFLVALWKIWLIWKICKDYILSGYRHSRRYGRGITSILIKRNMFTGWLIRLPAICFWAVHDVLVSHYLLLRCIAISPVVRICFMDWLWRNWRRSGRNIRYFTSIWVPPNMRIVNSCSKNWIWNYMVMNRFMDGWRRRLIPISVWWDW